MHTYYRLSAPRAPQFTSRQPEVTAAPADPLNRKPCPSPSAIDAAGPKKAEPKHSSFDGRAVQIVCRQHNIAPPVVPLSRKKLRQRVRAEDRDLKMVFAIH